MALIACKECGKEISSKAEACPACGAPVNWSSEFMGRSGSLSRAANLGCLTLLVGIVIFIAFLYLSDKF